MHEPGPPEAQTYLTVKQAAEYLHLNEKKIYALIQEGRMPATRATGKWIFPRKLLDEWLLQTAHGGALADRLVISGSDDPLLAFAVSLFAHEVGDSALVAYCPCGTRLGLIQLSKRRADVAAVHWGAAEQANSAHRSLIGGYDGHEQWVAVRMALREQGIMLGRRAHGGSSMAELLREPLRWVVRQAGAGSQHFFEREAQGRAPDIVVGEAYSERHAASLICQAHADCAPGIRSAATEFGLEFLPLEREAFDLIVPRHVYFRGLFQRLLSMLGSDSVRAYGLQLTGYDLASLGSLRFERDPL